MTSEQKIKCPHCGQQINIDEIYESRRLPPIPNIGGQSTGIEGDLRKWLGVGAVVTDAVVDAYSKLKEISGEEREWKSLEDIAKAFGKSTSLMSLYFNRLHFFGLVERDRRKKKLYYRPKVQQ